MTTHASYDEFFMGIALEEAKSALASYPELARVIFVAFSDQARQIYQEMLQEMVQEEVF